MPTWNLDDLYKKEDSGKLIAELKKQTREFTKLRSALKPTLSVEEFMNIIKQKEKLSELTSRLGAYAELWFTENTADSERTSYLSKISEICTDAGNETMFFSLWFKDLNDNDANKFIDNSGKYRYMLERIRANKPYTLKEKEEQIVNLKDLTGCEALTNLYDTITNRFVFEFEGKKLSQEKINQYKQSTDRNKRKASYDLVLGKYGEEQPVLGELYKNIVNDWKNENLKLRKFKTPIAVRNHGNDVPDKAIEALLNVVRKNVELFKEYFKIKKKLLNLKEMDRYDLYVPYKEPDIEYPYEESKKIVLETYKQFSQDAYEKAKKIFDDKHVHSELTPSKRSGAFCYTVLKDLPPYIMLNHVNKLNDLFTMMHEFGHGIHGMAASEQTQFTFHSALPMAETASIFGEMLLAQRLLKEADKNEKIAVLIKLLDGQYASIIRQAYFVLFEIEAHEKIANGATIEDLNKLYLDNLNEQFDGVLPIAEIFKYEWSYIPHIHHTPFYCYAYVFGNLLVLALYKMYEQKGPEFVSKYMKILSYGGSESPAKILKEVGIDITSDAFWQDGFDIIKEELEELKKLTS